MIANKSDEKEKFEKWKIFEDSHELDLKSDQKIQKEKREVFYKGAFRGSSSSVNSEKGSKNINVSFN